MPDARTRPVNLGVVLRVRYRLAIAIGVCCCALGVASSRGSGNQDRSIACGGGDHMGAETGGEREVRFLSGPAPAALTEMLGVLREPQTEAVQLPDSAVARLGFSEVWIDAVRRITTSGPWGIRVFVIPGVSGHGTCSPATPRVRANSGEPLVSVDMYNPSGRMGARAYTMDDIVGGRAFRIYPLPAAGDQYQLVLGLVPDDVSSVEIKAGDMPGRIVPVRDNFFEAQVRTSQGPTSAAISVTTDITWYNSSGKSLKTVSSIGRQAFLLRASVDIPGG